MQCCGIKMKNCVPKIKLLCMEGTIHKGILTSSSVYESNQDFCIYLPCVTSRPTRAQCFWYMFDNILGYQLWKPCITPIYSIKAATHWTRWNKKNRADNNYWYVCSVKCLYQRLFLCIWIWHLQFLYKVFSAFPQKWIAVIYTFYTVALIYRKHGNGYI